MPDVRYVDLPSRQHCKFVAYPEHEAPQVSAPLTRQARALHRSAGPRRASWVHRRITALVRFTSFVHGPPIGVASSLPPLAAFVPSTPGASPSSFLARRTLLHWSSEPLTSSDADKSTGPPDTSYPPRPQSTPRCTASRILTPYLTPACSGLATLAADARR